MAAPLNEEQQRHLRDLEANFDQHVATYRQAKAAELAAGAAPALREELANHERYLADCQASRIADVLINIRFRQAKVSVLTKLLDTYR